MEILSGYAVLPISCLVPSPFPCRFSEDPELDELTESVRAYGVLEPIVVRPKADGVFEIVMGGRRVKAAKKAGLREIPAIVKQLSDVEAALLQSTENIQRKDLSDDEKRKVLAFLSTFAKLSPKELAAKLKRSYSWVMIYLPDEFKNQVKADAGQKGGEARATALEQAATKVVAQSELDVAERKALQHRTQCQDPACLRFVPDEEIRYRNEKPYCLKCAPFVKEIIPAVPKEKAVSPKSLDTLEQKMARMKVHDSQFQQDVFVELANEGLMFETNVKLPVVETEPDGLQRDLNLLVYLDCTEVHKGKQLDKDEQIRELYKKHHPDVTILSIPFTGKSDRGKARVKALVREKYEFLKAEAEKWK